MWWYLALPFAAGGVAFWDALRYSRRCLRTWQDAAVSCGLTVVKISSHAAWRLKLEARVGPVAVQIESSRRGTRVQIVAPEPPGLSSLRIRPEMQTPLGWVNEIEVGDESFDKTFSVEGPPPRLVSALLDSATRLLLLEVNAASRLEIAGGELRAEMYDKDLPALLPLLLDLSRRLTQPVDVAQRLAESIRLDPVAGVRLRNLLLLVQECAWDSRTVKTLHVACADASSQVRLRAALELGAEGRFTLGQLAERAEDSCSPQAIAALGGELPLESTKAILARALRKRRIPTACACLEALGRSDDEAAVHMLAKVLERESGELAFAAAQALGTTGSAAAEPPLITALHRGERDVRVAAANALGRVGSAAAVLPLKEAAERSWGDQDLRRATRQAIAEIQTRLQGASPGQLSLAGAETGQLSLAQGEAGQLSLAQGEAGQLSLATDPDGQLSLPAPGQRRGR